MKATRFSFTLLRPNDAKIHLLDKLSDITFCVYGYERGRISHILHLQGYLELSKEIELFKLKSLLRGYYIEIARESREQNVIYCKKCGTFKLFDPLGLTK